MYSGFIWDMPLVHSCCNNLLGCGQLSHDLDFVAKRLLRCQLHPSLLRIL